MEQKQKAILVGVQLNNQQDFTDSMKESFNLANACDLEVVGEKIQKLQRIAYTFLPRGKKELLI